MFQLSVTQRLLYLFPTLLFGHHSTFRAPPSKKNDTMEPCFIFGPLKIGHYLPIFVVVSKRLRYSITLTALYSAKHLYITNLNFHFRKPWSVLKCSSINYKANYRRLVILLTILVSALFFRSL
jgi:hypothetical protein